MKVVDCRGMACPGPVIQAKKTLEGLGGGEAFVIEVDSEASRENVRRFAEGRGAGVRIDELTGGAYRLTITSGRSAGGEAPDHPPVVFITGDALGRGDDRLGGILMEGFINTLIEQDPVPDKVLMMNSGVRLAVDGSPVLDALRTLMDRGCEVLVCGTCLDFFSLTERLAAGSVSNMYDIQGALLRASSVIRP
ncbi:MAG: sulfurtransferase-like selenium metabolism protein YedF [bacterium]|nr:MAG: sulfurtransferase-like selenium metabolism protein YedF [bacterium]